MTATTAKTAVRHGELNGFVDWLKRQGYNPQVTEGTRADLENLTAENRFYGGISQVDKILLVEAPGCDRHNFPTQFFHIVL
jgi:hypothetical protein